MATLEKIRSKGVLLLIVVGLALLAFIVGDFMSSGSTYFSQKQMKVAEVSGEDVKIDEFLAAIDQLSTVYKFEMGSENLDEQTTEQIRQSVWETTIRERVLNEETAAIGMTVTKNELFDNILGEKTHPLILSRRIFANPSTNTFDKTILSQFLSVIDDEQAGLPEETKSYWAFWEKTVKNTLLEEKYNALLIKSLVPNKLEAEFAQELNANQVDILYSSQPYFMIPDSTVSVSEKEIKARYDKEKEKFRKPNAICSLDYVAFDIRPQQSDYEELDKWINSLKDEFATTSEVASFVNSNSDKRFVDAAVAKSDVEVEFRDLVFAGKKGDIVGPIFSNNIYKMVRILESGISSPDSVKLAHILVMEQSKERTESVADSLLAVLKGGADFASVAKANSKATQTAENGGAIGWLRELNMETEVAKKAFSAEKGAIFTMNTNGAIQIFKVEEVGAKVDKVKIASVERELIPSSRSQAQIFNDAKQFSASCKTAADFKKNAQEKGLTVFPAKNLDRNASRISDIKNSRSVVRWAFEQKAGAISDVFECEGMFLVACVDHVNTDDFLSVDEVSEMLKYEISREKKGEMLFEKMNGKTLANLAAEGMRVDTLKNITFEAQQMPGVGAEPVLFALASTTENSAPIRGMNGVYVYQILDKKATFELLTLEQEKMMLQNRVAYSVNYMAMEMLKKQANVKDNRHIVF